ncbi:hypothetical protein [Sporosarcina sp. HYO08]|uniref:hypothetical protein n=1 Tax=Sporosarcina sp. HYO08 TaxID=1759557 RepID=UPI0012E3AEFF|nr:hypothetical protein [Sporosarcina sp. HYO08]
MGTNAADADVIAAIATNADPIGNNAVDAMQEDPKDGRIDAIDARKDAAGYAVQAAVTFGIQKIAAAEEEEHGAQAGINAALTSADRIADVKTDGETIGAISFFGNTNTKAPAYTGAFVCAR